MKRQQIMYVVSGIIGFILGIVICYISPDIRSLGLISKIGVCGICLLMGLFLANFIWVLQSKGPDD